VLVLPAETYSTAETPPRWITGYPSAVKAIAAVMTGEFGLPLPDPVTVFVYAGSRSYEEGLARHGRMSAARAAQIAGYSVGLGQPRQLFINDGALRGASRSTWLAIVAHELTHVSQYELSGGRRGRSEQWVREGMADWIACHVLERLGEGSVARYREAARQEVRTLLRRDAELDLFALGRPLGWEQRQLGSSGSSVYRLAFLLTDDLIRQHGFERLRAYFRAFAASDDRLGHFHGTFGVSLADFEHAALFRLERSAGGVTAGGSRPRASHAPGDTLLEESRLRPDGGGDSP
jgi:hypothetical protein